MVFFAEDAEKELARTGQKAILVRIETSPEDLSGMNGATYPTIGGPEVIEVVSGIYSNEWKPNDEGIYEIYTVGHLYQFAKKVNDDGMSFQNMEVRLKNNIGLNNTENWESWNMNNAPKNKWTPIGNPSSPFKGTFDGQGHIVKGVKVDSEDYAGLFGIPVSYTHLTLPTT